MKKTSNVIEVNFNPKKKLAGFVIEEDEADVVYEDVPDENEEGQNSSGCTKGLKRIIYNY